MSLFAELKRRRVIRVSIAYIVVCWVILQVADVVFPAIPLPGWSMRAVLVVLVLAFPVVLLMASALCVPLAAADEDEPLDLSPTLHGKLALSITDAVAMGLKNNLDLEVQRFAPIIALQDAEGSWGAFDPTKYNFDIVWLDF